MTEAPEIFCVLQYGFGVLSEGFLEAQTKDINEGFPPDTLDYIDDYDYFSDSDLEDEPSCSAEEDGGPAGDDEPELRHCSRDSDSRVPLAVTPRNPPQSPQDPNQVESRHTSASNFVRLSKLSC